ncbi:MAG: hypothetical protein F4X51_11035 [Gemmatimonadetes bacterium]|nr:hypothetical protein [Gemmatimonadota bacterium]
MNRKKKTRRVVFLDIDGVLQPPSQQNRFKHDLDQLRGSLAKKFNDVSYLDMDKYDLGAIYYDWRKDAVDRLRRLCEDFDADIVISSDWRSRKTVSLLKAYFRIHGLHQFVIDMTNEISRAPHYRAGEVEDYIDAHPEIERFVIFDDSYKKEFDHLFKDQFVWTYAYITELDDRRARQILSGVPITQENEPRTKRDL